MSIFTNKVTRTLLALAVVAMWALPFSLIKLGMAEFGVQSGDVPGEALFAGVRFFTAGVALLVVSRCMGKRISVAGRGLAAARGWAVLVLFGMVNIGLHYLLFYSGLGVSSGGRASVIYSSETFILILLSCLLFADDKMSGRKAFGCLLGFTGIAMVNLDFADLGNLFSNMTLEGDGMMLMAALAGACGGLLTRFATRHADAFVATGVSLVVGGGALIILGVALGGQMPRVTPLGLGVLAVLVFVSAAAFAIYNKLISLNPVSTIAIFNSLIPILGLLFSCVILSEPFRLEYVLAALIAACGVVVVNLSPKK